MLEVNAHVEPASSPARVTPESASAYIERRLKPRLAWCDAASKHAKSWHY